jgi:hypothetical protein
MIRSCVLRGRICSLCYWWTLENIDEAEKAFSEKVWTAIWTYASPEAVQLMRGEITRDKFNESVEKLYGNPDNVLKSKEKIKQADKVAMMEKAIHVVNRRRTNQAEQDLPGNAASAPTAASRTGKRTPTEQELDRMSVEEGNKQKMVCHCGLLNSCISKLLAEDTLPMFYNCRSFPKCEKQLEARCQHPPKSGYCWTCEVARKNRLVAYDSDDG